MPWPLSSGAGPRPGTILLPDGVEVAATYISAENPYIRIPSTSVQYGVGFAFLSPAIPPIPPGWRSDSYQIVLVGADGDMSANVYVETRETPA